MGAATPLFWLFCLVANVWWLIHGADTEGYWWGAAFGGAVAWSIDAVFDSAKKHWGGG